MRVTILSDSTFNFLLQVDSDIAAVDSVNGNTGISVVQMLYSLLFYDGSLCDL